MKCRKGFVSNSSSSSFIVAAPKDLEKVTISIDLHLEHCGLATTIDSVEKWRSYIEKNYSYYIYKTVEDICKDDETVNKLYNDGLEKLNNDQKIVVFILSSDDYDPVGNMLYDETSLLEEAIIDASCERIFEGG
jgi:hypothetical protein